jgi:hypothetical protein
MGMAMQFLPDFGIAEQIFGESIKKKIEVKIEEQ